MNDSLTLWEQDGYLCHNATVGDYADQMDVDAGPGYARLEVNTSDRIQVDADAGDDYVDASRITSRGITMFGGSGSDTLIGSNTLSPWGDYIDGGSRDDVLIGLGGDDLLVGRGGNDQIDGGPGNDILQGGENDDTIVMGTGLDEVDGGPGQDSMTFNGAPGEFHIYTFGDNTVLFAAGDGSTTGLFGAAGCERGDR